MVYLHNQRYLSMLKDWFPAESLTRWPIGEALFFFSLLGCKVGVGQLFFFLSATHFKCLSQTKACNNLSAGDTAWLFWLCENNFLHVTMIQQLSSVFWGQWNRRLWREEGKKVSTEERNRNIFKKARTYTDYILCSGSVEGLLVQFALALFQVLVSPEQTSELHSAKHG